MRRVPDTNFPVRDMFGKGKHGFGPGDKTNGTIATIPGAAFMNSVQEELAQAIELSGIELNPEDNTQLFQAMRAAGFPQIASIAALRANTNLALKTVLLSGYHTGSTAGGGIFIADPSDTTTPDNGGTVIVDAAGVRWKRSDGRITPFHFGATGDGWSNDDEAFARLERALNTQPVDLQGHTFFVTAPKSGNRYYNGSFKTAASGAYPQELLHHGAGLYYKNIGNSQKLATLQTVAQDGLNEYVQSVRQDFKTGDLWMLQIDSGNAASDAKASLVKFHGMLHGGELPYSFYSKPSDLIGHQTFGIAYRENKRWFWTTCGSAKGTQRGRYVSRFTVNESTRDLEEQRTFKILPDRFDGNVNNCVDVTPNGEFLIFTCSENKVRNGQTQRHWYCNVFRIDDIGQSSDENLPTPLFRFPLHAITPYGSSGGHYAVQDVVSDGQYIYVMHGNTSLSRNATQVYTLDGALVLEDEQNFIGIEYAKSIAEGGGTTYYEPESFAVLQDGSELYLAYGFLAGVRQGESRKNFALYRSIIKKPLLAQTVGSKPALILASAVDMAFPKGGTLRIDELNPDGTTEKAVEMSRHHIELVNAAADAQVRVGNAKRRGLFQVSGAGNLGIFDNTNSKWLLYSGADGVGKLGTLPDASANGSELVHAAWVKALLNIEVRKAANGWLKLPGGLIAQWLTAHSESNSGTVDLPIAFPNKVLYAFVSETMQDDAQPQSAAWIRNGTTNSQIRWKISGTRAGLFSVFAIGY